MFEADRFKRAIAAVVRELFPQLTYSGLFAYTVSSWDDASQTAELVPTNPQSIGLPALVKVPVRTPGMKVKLAPGTAVLLGFVNHDPSQPYISHLDTAGTGQMPLSIALLGGTLAIARVGDMVASGGPTTQIILGAPGAVGPAPQGVPIPVTWVTVPVGGPPGTPSPFLAGMVMSGNPRAKA